MCIVFDDSKSTQQDAQQRVTHATLSVVRMLLDGNREIDAETKHKLSATTQQRCIVVVLVLLLGVIYFPDFQLQVQ